MYKIILFIGSLALVSCKSDTPALGIAQLNGSWDIVQATRDGEIFDALAGGYFEFKADEHFQTNIPSLPDGMKYRLRERTISFEGDTLKYNVSQFSDSILVLESNIRGSAFQFTCRKK